VHALLAMAGRGLAIVDGLVDTNAITVWLLGIDGRDVLLRSGQLLLHRYLLMVIISAAHPIHKLSALLFKRIRISLEVAIVVDGRRHALQLETDAGRARPGIRRCCVALDLPPPTPFARSHHYTSISAHERWGGGVGRFTLQALVAIVFIDEDIICHQVRFVELQEIAGCRAYSSDSLLAQYYWAQTRSSASDYSGGGVFGPRARQPLRFESIKALSPVAFPDAAMVRLVMSRSRDGCDR
jgi:hypothetical protein